MLVYQTSAAAECGQSVASQDWVKRLRAERDPLEAAATAMLRMMETQGLLYKANGTISKSESFSPGDLAGLIETLIPGEFRRSLAAADALTGFMVLASAAV